jgi:hypothetical protein
LLGYKGSFANGDPRSPERGNKSAEKERSASRAEKSLKRETHPNPPRELSTVSDPTADFTKSTGGPTRILSGSKSHRGNGRWVLDINSSFSAPNSTRIQYNFLAERISYIHLGKQKFCEYFALFANRLTRQAARLSMKAQRKHVMKQGAPRTALV